MAVDIVERLKRAQVTRATYKLHGVEFEGFASPVVGERDSNAELDFVMQVFKDCADEIERLRAERDDARRMLCQFESRLNFEYGNVNPSRFGPVAIAAERGWDCYEREQQPRKGANA